MANINSFRHCNHMRRKRLQNYKRVLFHCFQEEVNGLGIHCIVSNIPQSGATAGVHPVSPVRWAQCFGAEEGIALAEAPVPGITSPFVTGAGACRRRQPAVAALGSGGVAFWVWGFSIDVSLDWVRVGCGVLLMMSCLPFFRSGDAEVSTPRRLAVASLSLFLLMASGAGASGGGVVKGSSWG